MPLLREELILIDLGRLDPVEGGLEFVGYLPPLGSFLLLLLQFLALSLDGRLIGIVVGLQCRSQFIARLVGLCCLCPFGQAALMKLN